MAQQLINTGTANAGNGDTLRNGAIKINENFTELYATKVPLPNDQLISGSALITNGVQIYWGIPTIPTASTSVLGGVKVDGTTITINNGVISAVLTSAIFEGGTVTNPTHITSIISSTEITNGAFIVDGGVGVARDINVGGALNINAAAGDAANYINFNNPTGGGSLTTFNNGLYIKGGNSVEYPDQPVGLQPGGVNLNSIVAWGATGTANGRENWCIELVSDHTSDGGDPYFSQLLIGQDNNLTVGSYAARAKSYLQAGLTIDLGDLIMRDSQPGGNVVFQSSDNGIVFGDGTTQTSASSATIGAVESRNYFLDLYNHEVGGDGYGQGHFIQIQGQEITDTFAFGTVAQYIKFGGSVGIEDAKHIVLAPDDANGWTMDLGGQTINQTGFIPPGNTYISNSYINYMYVGNQVIYPDYTTQTTAYQKTAVPTHNYGQAGDVQGMVAYDATYFYYCTANFVNTSTVIWKRTAWGNSTW